MVTEPYRISEPNTGFSFGVSLINLRFQGRVHVFLHFFACVIYVCEYVLFNQDRKALRGVNNILLSFLQAAS